MFIRLPLLNYMARKVAYCDSKDSEDIKDVKIRESLIGQWRPWTREWDNDWDKKNSSSKKMNSGKVKHLILIRHGQYDLKTGDLTELGKEQARLTALRLKHMVETPIEDHYGRINVKFNVFAHSNVSRAKQTAEIIAKTFNYCEPICDPILAEGWPCIPEGYLKEVNKSEIFQESARVEAAFRKYVNRPTDWTIPKNSEKLQDETGEDEEKHEYVLLVCHQNVIRYFLCRALQLPPEYWLRFKGDNCGITEIIIYDTGKVSLAKFADVGHLPNDKHTFH